MSETDPIQPYYQRIAAAFVRGCALTEGTAVVVPQELLCLPLGSLADEQLETIIQIGMEAGLRLHRFKQTHEKLPRVRRVLGMLSGIATESLLDVGSGEVRFCGHVSVRFQICTLQLAKLIQIEYNCTSLYKLEESTNSNLYKMMSLNWICLICHSMWSLCLKCSNTLSIRMWLLKTVCDWPDAILSFPCHRKKMITRLTFIF